MRGGLDADDRDSREQIFGNNILDIKQKPVSQLLIDEVSVNILDNNLFNIFSWEKGFSSILYIPNR